ncbi:orotidine-5'-phosphate decarboxylase [Methyloceanibacter sp.]|uniref:orotidine-5'-phosphate decarboxylase n=1 Tax=Methyloceanibacter sp. TaxID=1965321 RepID=UPI002F432422
MASIAPRDRLIVALDTPTVEGARALVARLGPAVTFYKIGLELVMAGGLELARELAGQGARVFLDMKLLDIENTVARSVRNAAASGATFLTVHAQDGKTLRAAVSGRAGTGLKVLGVTVLTNLDAGDLREQGIDASPADLVVRRATLARDAGCDGVVASGHEAARVRAIVEPHMAIVTPGIRLAGGEAGDQARVTTPEQAIAAGADYIVVGRPISASADPAAAAQIFTHQIEQGLAKRPTRIPS